jgi:hypothetical protein
MRAFLAAGLALLVLWCSQAGAQSITKVSTSNVQLQAGGSAVPLTIEGTSMNTVTAVRLLNGGSAVSAVLRRTAGSTSSVVVDLSASTTAPAGSYQAELILSDGRRISVPAAITVSVTLRPAAQVGGEITLPAPTVTRATPAATALRANGPSQTVVLEGTMLDKVTRAYFERSGSPVYGLRGELRPTTDPARRTIVLSAPAAQPPWDSPSALVLEGQMMVGPIARPVRVATPVSITVAAPVVPPTVPVALPDLVVAVSVSPTSGPPQTQFTIKVTVKNVGGGKLGALGPASLGTQCLTAAMGVGSSEYFRRDATLEPGQSVVVFQKTTNPGVYGIGPVTLDCTADPYKQVAESNENNNRFVIPFSVTR